MHQILMHVSIAKMAMTIIGDITVTLWKLQTKN